MLLILGALTVGGWIAWDLFGPSDRDPDKPLPSIPEPAERLAVARPMPATSPAAVSRTPGAPAGPRVLVIGDSITAGGYYKRIKLPGVDVRGQGWGGQQAVYVARAAADLLKSFKPTDVVILVGVNNEASEVVSAVKRGGMDVATLIAHVKRDLTHAWRILHEAGARVWACTMTPWYGYAKYFGDGKATDAPMRAVHEAVNAWIVAMRGQPGGPDEVIDTSAMGDAQGRLLAAYTRDHLHPATADGQRALAGIVERRLRGDGAAAVVGVEPAVPAGRTVLFLGDSLTASDYWRKVALPEGAVTGKGWPGNRIAQIMAKAADLIAATRPTDVVLLAGVNDLAGGRKAEAINADLDAAWTAIIAAGAHPWAVLPTPWFGYTGGRAGEARPMFFADPATAAKLRAATEAVRAFIRGRAGQEGGPVAAIDTASLGDAQGRLLANYSHDSLHMNGKGYAALASLVEAALRGGTNMQTTAGGVFTAAMFDGVLVGAELARAEFGYHDSEGEGVAVGYDATRAVVGDDGDINWPPGWRPAPQNVVDAVNEASAKFGVPRDIILSIIWKESRFNPKLVGYKNATTDTSSKAYSPTFQASYARNKDLRIPGGGGMTWGQMFTPAQWTVYGVMQTMPFNLVGKPDGVKAGAPLSQMFDVRKNILCGTALLATLHAKYGNWPTAILRFNGAKSYQREVLANVDALKQAQAA